MTAINTPFVPDGFVKLDSAYAFRSINTLNALRCIRRPVCNRAGMFVAPGDHQRIVHAFPSARDLTDYLYGLYEAQHAAFSRSKLRPVDYTWRIDDVHQFGWGMSHPADLLLLCQERLLTCMRDVSQPGRPYQIYPASVTALINLCDTGPLPRLV